MPLLSMDHVGNIVEADSTRTDGQGIGRIPFSDAPRDVALTNPTLWAEEQRKRQLKNRLDFDKLQERNRVERERFIKKQKEVKAYRDKAEKARLAELKAANMGQDVDLEEACKQGQCGAEYEQMGLSGYGFSSDGTYCPDALASQQMGRSADWDALEQETSDHHSSTDIIKTADFGSTPRHMRFSGWPLDQLQSAASGAIQQTVSSVGGALSSLINPASVQSQAQAASVAQATAAAEQAKAQAAALELQKQQMTIAQQMAYQQQLATEKSSTDTKKYLMFGGAAVAVLLVGGFIFLKLKK